MAYTTIDDPSAHFTTTLYTGNGSDDRSITNSANAGNFKPDWIWLKQRDQTRHHILNDSNRGATKNISTSLTNAESTGADGIQAFETNGFQVGTDTDVNQNSGTYVAWQWKANGGSASASGTESGLNAAYSRQTNSTAGFSIITYTGLGTSGSGSSPVVPHGLGAVPDMLIIKNRSSGSTDWAIWWKTYNSAGTNVFQGFDTGAHGGSGGASHFGDVAPDATNVSLGATPGSGDTASNRTNTDGDNYVMYAFKEIKGYSKFGKYVGNGSTSGTFVNLGFKPAFIMFKRADDTSQWNMIDNTRPSYGNANPNGVIIKANASGAEETNNSATVVDLVSNGFRHRNTEGNYNGNGAEYVFMAFAEHPFVSSDGVPKTAT